MKIQTASLIYAGLALTVGCSTYKRWDFNGEVLIDEENYTARIESVRISEGGSSKRNIGYDNGKLKATGMRFTYNSKNQEENEYSDFRAFYSKGRNERREMEVVYWGQDGPWGFPENRITAYLIPVGATEAAEKDHNDDSAIIPIEKGTYNVYVTFLENGEEQDLEFSFDYRYRVSFHEPQFDVSGKK
jgi:hypothetical protein